MLFLFFNKKAIETKRKNGTIGNGMLNKKHSVETKEKMSKVRIIGLSNGSIPYPQGWRSQLSQDYKGYHCQSSYEVDFLKHAESLGKLNLIENGPVLEYYCNTEKKLRKYIVDFRIKNTNILIEVKSTWVLNNHLENYKDKAKSTKDKNYNLFLVLDKNYSQIDKILKNA